MKILHANLNLRIEKGKTNNDYTIKKDVAENQLSYDNIDIYTNVEYMECQNSEYHQMFLNKNYKPLKQTWDKQRGIICYIKNDIDCEIIKAMNSPHFIHLKAKKNTEIFNIIVFRILVSDSSKQDFIERKEQFDTVLTYLDELDSLDNIILLGDWNHAYIRSKYENNHNQKNFSYQYICNELVKREIQMGFNLKERHTEHSYKGYLAIDHVAIGKSLQFEYGEYHNPKYSKYDKNAPIGVPDHAFILCNVLYKL